MTKYFVNGSGDYVGAFDGAPAPVGSFEVGVPPPDGRAKWNGIAWFIPDNLKTELVEAQREKAIKDQGISLDEKVSALWERVMNNNAKPSDDLQVVIEKAKTDFPDPV